MPLDIGLDDLQMGKPDHDKLAELYTLLEFKSWFDENQRDAKRSGQEVCRRSSKTAAVVEAKYEHHPRPEPISTPG